MGSEGVEAAEEFQSELCHQLLFASHLSFGQVVLDSSLSLCQVVLDSPDCYVFQSATKRSSLSRRHDCSKEHLLGTLVWVEFRADQGSDRSGSRTVTGPIRAIAVGNPTVDDTTGENRLEAHSCNPPSGLI